MLIKVSPHSINDMCILSKVIDENTIGYFEKCDFSEKSQKKLYDYFGPLFCNSVEDYSQKYIEEISELKNILNSWSSGCKDDWWKSHERQILGRFSVKRFVDWSFFPKDLSHVHREENSLLIHPDSLLSYLWFCVFMLVNDSSCYRRCNHEKCNRMFYAGKPKRGPQKIYCSKSHANVASLERLS